MPPVQPKSVSVAALINESKRMSGSLFNVNTDHNAWVTKAEAAKLPASLKDNYDNYRAARGNRGVTQKEVAASFTAYVTAHALRADKNGDGIISATEARYLPTDLKDNFKALVDANRPGTGDGASIKKELAKFANELTLTFFGEDDGGGSTKAIYSKGPFAKLERVNAFDLVNTAFGRGKWGGDKDWGTESFAPGAGHDELWARFKDYDSAMSGSVDKMAELFKDATLHVVTVDTAGTFRGTAFLVAQMADGSLVGLKGDVAGMGF
jgi:hypothetical protein